MFVLLFGVWETRGKYGWFFFFFLRNGIEVSNFEKRTFHSIILSNSSKIQVLGTNYIKLKMIIVSFL